MAFNYPAYLQPLPYYSLPPQQEVIQRAWTAKTAGKKIVIASGVFDLLHEAHKTYLQKAKEQGDYLIVLLESDIRTKELKGPDRPVWDQNKRKEEIMKLGFVDDVLILPPEFKNPLRYEEIVILLAPNVFAVSSNSVALDHKKNLMEKYGGEMHVVLDEIPGVSTTTVLQSRGVQ
ncbi:MAG TPA: adenylyltransferase/cytidyltransferase family protein [Patescibacteria group bacterium]|nr:adenylyltransferase/cytidyltransferase family protein [Patescibacteria group bacterium]